MLTFIRKVARRARDRGASAVEYGLLVAAIAAVIVAVVFGLGRIVQGALTQTSTDICEQNPKLTGCPGTP